MFSFPSLSGVVRVLCGVWWACEELRLAFSTWGHRSLHWDVLPCQVAQEKEGNQKTASKQSDSRSHSRQQELSKSPLNRRWSVEPWVGKAPAISDFLECIRKGGGYIPSAVGEKHWNVLFLLYDGKLRAWSPFNPCLTNVLLIRAVSIRLGFRALR